MKKYRYMSLMVVTAILALPLRPLIISAESTVLDDSNELEYGYAHDSYFPYTSQTSLEGEAISIESTLVTCPSSQCRYGNFSGNTVLSRDILIDRYTSIRNTFESLTGGILTATNFISPPPFIAIENATLSFESNFGFLTREDVAAQFLRARGFTQVDQNNRNQLNQLGVNFPSGAAENLLFRVDAQFTEDMLRAQILLLITANHHFIMIHFPTGLQRGDVFNLPLLGGSLSAAFLIEGVPPQNQGELRLKAPTLLDFGTHPITITEPLFPILNSPLEIYDTRTNATTDWELRVRSEGLSYAGSILSLFYLVDGTRLPLNQDATSIHSSSGSRNISDLWDNANGLFLDVSTGVLPGTYTGTITWELVDGPLNEGGDS